MFCWMFFAIVSCLESLGSNLLVFDFVDLVRSAFRMHDYGSFMLSVILVGQLA